MNDITKKSRRKAGLTGIAIAIGLAGLSLTAGQDQVKRADHDAGAGVSNGTATAASAPGQVEKGTPPNVGAAEISTATAVTTIKASRSKGKPLTAEEKQWAKSARPTSSTNLRLLDLSKTPSEKDLRMAGQLGEELQPTRGADHSKVADVAARQKLESDNRSFGRAIQEWNLHHYDKAQELFIDHLAKHPDSPWAAEAELHLGCVSQYLGKFQEAKKWFDASTTRAPLGHAMHQKALLRQAALAMQSGSLNEAALLFTKLRENDTDLARKTYASYWIRELGMMKAKETALRDCGQKSLGEICEALGKPDDAQALRNREAAGPHGFTIQELEQVAGQHGLNAQTVRAEAPLLKELPLPWVAHYRDQHFVAVLERQSNGILKIYDTRVGHAVDMSSEMFLQQWTGLAMIFRKVEKAGIRLASVAETQEAMGGCCGYPIYPNNLGCLPFGLPFFPGQTPPCPPPAQPKPYKMPVWQVNPINLNLVIGDVPMWWHAPYGPDVDLELTYNSMDSLIPLRPFGEKWMFSYASYLVVDPSGSVKVIRSDGHGQDFTPNGSGGYNANSRIASLILRKIAGSDYRYELEDVEGTKFLYDVPPAMAGQSASSLLLSITDKYGIALTITHNAQGAITSISHPAAVTTLSPTGSWDFVYNQAGTRVTAINDPFGRTATFSYDASERLTGQTDMGGLAYGYGYTTTPELFINALILPTGTTQFYTEPASTSISLNFYPASGAVMGGNYRITATDPLGQKEEFYFNSPTGDAWYRDKNHYVAGESGSVKTRYYFSPVDGKGEIRKIDFQGGGSLTHNSFNTGGQPLSTTAPNGHTYTYTYNAKGKMLTSSDNNATTAITTDDILITNVYAANNLDVVQVKRTINGVVTVLANIEYDPVTRDITATVDRAGLRTEYTRNAHGQVLTVTNPRGDIASGEYNADGYLETARFQPLGQAATVQGAFVYDDEGRVVSQTDSNGYVLIHEYNDLNQLVKTTYPDATFSINNWNCCFLDSTVARDGSVTQYSHDALKRLTSVISPGKQIQTYLYDKVGNLTQFSFGRGEWVKFEYDTAYRNLARVYMDGTRLTYGYDTASGRLLWSKDAQQRQTTYAYDTPGRLITVTHPSLPTQSYTYNVLSQPLSWTDGTRVTAYTYDTLDRPATVDGPLADDTVSYTYDQWGRMNATTYAGGTGSITFDALGRAATITNPLGTFTPTYDGETGRVTQLAYPLAGLSTNYALLPFNQDRRLSEITHTGPGNVELAKFGYTYAADHTIATWSQTQPGLNPGRQWAISHDADGQMKSVVETPLVGPVTNPQKVWRYDYDASGNRTLSQESMQTSTTVSNQLNQLTSLSSGGLTWFRGQVDEPAQVTIGGKAAKVSGNGTFETLLNLGAGSHDVPMQATDKAGNVTSETWRVDNGAFVIPRTLTYDAEGNLLADGKHTYTWDARNRLISVSMEGNTWSFTYDGANRRVSEQKNGVPVREWVWSGTEIIEERLADGTKRRFWSGGIEILNSAGVQTGKRYLLTDHLGSTRVVVDGSGAVTTSYDYTPWGKRTKISGTEDWNTGYTGHWWHESGLSLTLFRVYDPELGRWISRDPIAEAGGPNLYAYVGNGPVGVMDPLGLEPNSSTFWKNYPYPKENFNPSIYSGGFTTDQVYVDLVGGWLGNMHKSGAEDYYNSCALRISIALNKSGEKISKSSSGANAVNGKFYIISVLDLHSLLLKKWGKPDCTIETGDDVTNLQARLKPGQAAVVVAKERPGDHAGVVKKDFRDQHTPSGVSSVWILPMK